MNRRRFLQASAGAGLLLSGAPSLFGQPERRASRPNVLLITADDLAAESVGFNGCTTPNITPHMDRLAGQGMHFEHAHVACAICQPSRQSMMTGRYPGHNGAPGFDPIDEDVPTLQEQLHRAGYLNGILGKVTHLAPQARFAWDFVHDWEDLARGRDAQSYYGYTKQFLSDARREDKPFFLMANSHDPHRPFWPTDRARWADDGIPPPPRVYRPDEVQIPGFLPDLPEIRKEMAQYYSSVSRLDQTVGEILRALDESGMADNTVVMFSTDHGMPLPFAKSNCYPQSTRSPWIVRWPGRIQPGTVDREHFICGVDFMPTVLELCGLDGVAGMEGRSFAPLFTGGRQSGRESVVTMINSLYGNSRVPMRAIQNRRYTYIHNIWCNGRATFRNESQSGLTWKAMVAAADHDEWIRRRVDLFSHRVPEELYDLEHDPHCLRNLIDDPAHQEQARQMREQLLAWLERTGDSYHGRVSHRIGRITA